MKAKKYKCTECNWSGVFKEMKNEQDIDYDQYCCPKCYNVMYDCLLDKWYLEEEHTLAIRTKLRQRSHIKEIVFVLKNDLKEAQRLIEVYETTIKALDFELKDWDNKNKL